MAPCLDTNFQIKSIEFIIWDNCLHFLDGNYLNVDNLLTHWRYPLFVQIHFSLDLRLTFPTIFLFGFSALSSSLPSSSSEFFIFFYMKQLRNRQCTTENAI